MKGILLAGGSGTRLAPSTIAISKHLLPIYDKPMIYYSLSVLMLAGIQEVAIIGTSQDIPRYQTLLGDGSTLGMSLTYYTQDTASGIAEAFHITEGDLAGNEVCLALGDNLLYGGNLTHLLHEARRNLDGATVFAYRVKNPSAYGVVSFDSEGKASYLEEKPCNPRSPFAVIGLYFYGADVFSIAKTIEPSARGELEITAVNQRYLEEQRLQVRILSRGMAWMDTGTPQGLLDASNFIYNVEARQGIKIACIEEIAWRNGWITATQLRDLAKDIKNVAYSQYLLQLLEPYA